MGKLVPLRQTMDIETIVTEHKIGGMVTKSNFVVEGKRHLMPIHDKLVGMISEGDKIRVTFYSDDNDVHRGPGNSIRFKPQGVKYEKWNKENQGWDRLFEEMEIEGQ
jgi:CBS domain-containing protein